MEIQVKTFSQLEREFKSGTEATYGRVQIAEVVKGKIRLHNCDKLFKPWLPAVRLLKKSDVTDDPIVGLCEN